MSGLAVRHVLVKAHDRARRRPVWIEVWLPLTDRAAHPVVLLSHGAFGAPGNYAWLAEHLARHRCLVAGVCHHGESFVYGPDTVDVAAAGHPEDRPRDASFALDHLLGDPRFGHAIDPSRVGALGHSSGGATAIALAGGLFDRTAMARYCASADALADKGCAYAQGGSTPPPEGPQSGRDDRVRAVVALDPALGPGFDADSLAGIAAPVLVIGAVDNDFLPFEHHAGRFARLIPGAALTRLERGEGHFVSLNRGEIDMEVQGVPLYRDRPGVDRAGVHARLGALICRFFDAHLLLAGPDPL